MYNIYSWCVESLTMNEVDSPFTEDLLEISFYFLFMSNVIVLYSSCPLEKYILQETTKGTLLLIKRVHITEHLDVQVKRRTSVPCSHCEGFLFFQVASSYHYQFRIRKKTMF